MSEVAIPAVVTVRKRTRLAFGLVGGVLSVAMIVAIVLSFIDDTTLAVPFAAVFLALGVYYVAAAASGYITDSEVTAVVRLGDERPEASDHTLFWVGIVFAIFLPVVGFVIGVVFLIRGRNSYGLRLIVGSIGFTILWYRLLIAA